jgi:hypothetical protein
MDTDIEKSRDYRFTVGLVTGAVVGVGLAIWLGPGLAAGLRRGTTRWVRHNEHNDRSAGPRARACADPPAGTPQAL